MSWHVWTDGSCAHGLAQVPKGMRGHGGWAAIVEHGSDGTVYRGRQKKTTNVRMELVAAIEGLKGTPEGAHVVLHTDATTVAFAVAAGLNQHSFSTRDRDLWEAVAAESRKRDVTVKLIVKGDIEPLHRRAHVIAGAEAKGSLKALPTNAQPMKIDRALRDGQRKAALEMHETRRRQVERASAFYPAVVKGSTR